ncbi:MupG family TIM beta-alpha barrel fold protein [Anaerorhabdus sp.]|uniref:MupG family TIM beta-alpha barrel fold protein n=1 Tax=Anaerorhabdus sp. TaxID=1872524 RepID=UPI002FC7097D
MLGVSAYFKDLDLNYLEEVSKCGVKFVFTSIHIPEDDKEDIERKLPIFIEQCQKLDLFIVPDVSPRTFEKLGLSINDFEGLKNKGFKAIRLDFGFDDPAEITKLQKDFIVMLNASVMTKEDLLKCEKAGLELDKIILTHNFYPHKNTGLDENYFIERNSDFVSMGLRIQAFVCGDDLRRYPLYEGLPTLEKHRGINPFVASVELMKKYGITEIMIGDSKAKIETIKHIHEYMENNVIHIKASLEEPYEYMYNECFSIRPDSGKLIRLAIQRNNNVEQFHTVNRPVGSITMDNQLYGRYSGEVSLVNDDLECDARVNVIGYIHQEYIPLLAYLDKEIRIKFIR